MKIALSGGGSERDSELTDRHFAFWLSPKSRLLYLPIAFGRPNGRYADADSWIRRVFEPLGIVSITMWDELHSHGRAELFQFDAVYIGGGNTYLLIYQLRQTGFDRLLQEFSGYDRPIFPERRARAAWRR